MKRMKMEPGQFEKEYTVHVYETGPDGKVNLFSLFNYMQDIASDHAEKLGFGRSDLLKYNNFWVLSRMYAEIDNLPSWKEKLIASTWPCGTDNIFAMRSYKIRFPDGRPIASATSSWLIIDRTTKKIRRPGEMFTQYNSDNKKLIPPVRNPEKLHELPGNCEEVSRFRVRISDLDVNLHTNNVNYLKWACDTYSLSFAMDHHPYSAEINYLAESMFNDEIIIRSVKKDEGNSEFSDHSILRIGDNKELCRIRLKWKETNNVKS